jgi:hypothetical protein
LCEAWKRFLRWGKDGVVAVGHGRNLKRIGPFLIVMSGWDTIGGTKKSGDLMTGGTERRYVNHGKSILMLDDPVCYEVTRSRGKRNVKKGSSTMTFLNEQEHDNHVHGSLTVIDHVKNASKHSPC